EFKPGKWMVPSDKAMTKFKKRVKEITRRNQTVDVQQLVKKKLNPYLRGWGNYFGMADVQMRFRDLDKWIRRRLRSVQLRSWRKVRKLHREMRRRGWKSRDLPGLRMTAWRSSHSVNVNINMYTFACLRMYKITCPLELNDPSIGKIRLQW